MPKSRVLCDVILPMANCYRPITEVPGGECSALRYPAGLLPMVIRRTNRNIGRIRGFPSHHCLFYISFNNIIPNGIRHFNLPHWPDQCRISSIISQGVSVDGYLTLNWAEPVLSHLELQSYTITGGSEGYTVDVTVPAGNTSWTDKNNLGAESVYNIRMNLRDGNNSRKGKSMRKSSENH